MPGVKRQRQEKATANKKQKLSETLPKEGSPPIDEGTDEAEDDSDQDVGEDIVDMSDDVLFDRYRASMVLAGVGDAMGYRNGVWEFNYSGKEIHEQMNGLGGIESLDIKGWGVSDDQVMHLATAEALIEGGKTKREGGLIKRSSSKAGPELYKTLSTNYVASFEDMAGRAPGPTTQRAISAIRRLGRWDAERYSKAGGGCGGSMRAMCIGLLFCGESKREDLISCSIESGRMTHNHPTGFFGALTSALFTAFAVEDVPPTLWGVTLVEDILPRAYTYLRSSSVRNGKDEWELYQEDLKFFDDKWRSYLKKRGIQKKTATVAKFPKKYGVKERDAFYSSVSWAGWGGASGHDSVIIAYDALLGCAGSWEELVNRGILHGGDNDSTGCIAGAWFGALYGFEGVPELNYKNLEYRERAERAADMLLRDSRL